MLLDILSLVAVPSLAALPSSWNMEASVLYDITSTSPMFFSMVIGAEQIVIPTEHWQDCLTLRNSDFFSPMNGWQLPLARSGHSVSTETKGVCLSTCGGCKIGFGSSSDS
jgi:hypothetical protein